MSELSLLAEGREAFLQGDYTKAVACYEQLLPGAPDALQSIVEFNRQLALRRLQLQQGGQVGEHGAHTAKMPCSLGGHRFSALHQLEWDGDLQLWRSTGDDPHFCFNRTGLDGINLDSTGLAENQWYLLHLLIRSSHKYCDVKLYFDYGDGFNEQDTQGFRLVPNDPVLRVVQVQKPLRSIRFDPMEGAGTFSLPVFKLVQTDEKQAINNICHWLNLHWRKDAGNSKYKTDTLTPAELFKCYQQALAESGKRGSARYDEWIEQVERPSLPGSDHITASLSQWHRPLISVVMPVYNTPEHFLRQCINSVRCQSYPNWELCIADDCSSSVHIKPLLQEYEQLDPRIRVVYRTENGHISRCSNSALEIAKGEYVALLDHDDLLPEHALYFVAEALNCHPDAQILYSDEDKIDEHGQRFNPHFKSDWNPDLFYSQNYVSHLGVYRRTLLNTIKGFRTGVEGAQDQDLLLRCLPHVRHDEIIHIPRILYHWRALDGSTALASSEKDYTTQAGIRALHDYFTHHGPAGIEVRAGLLPNTYRVCWPIPDPAPLVSLLIPTRDMKEITELAVRSILDKTTYTHYEILILDNGSIEPETLEWFADIQQQDKRVKVLRYDYPFNYSAINNFGVKHANGSIIGLVNNDVEVISPDWLTEMVSHAIRPDIGCVGAKLYYSDGRIQHGGVILGIGGVANHAHYKYPKESFGYFARLIVSQNYAAVTAACLLVCKEIYEYVEGLDEDNLAIAFNDVDLCLKVREAGYRNLWTPYAELYHHESLSRGQEDTPEKQYRFQKEVETMQARWENKLLSDPCYNPNLTKIKTDFSLGNF